MTNNEIKKDKNKIKEEIERILGETKVTFKLARVTGSESIYTMETGKEFDSFVQELTDYITKSNREVLEDYRCKVTQGILSQVQDNVELTKFINDLDQAYLSQLNKEGK